MAEKLTSLAKRLRPFLLGAVQASASSGALMSEGPDIDLVGDRIGRGGDTILLADSGGNPLAEFAATQAGLVAAIAAWGADDVISGPLAASIACTSTVTLAAGMIVKDISLAFYGFSGHGLVLADYVQLYDCQIVFDGAGQAEATAVFGEDLRDVVIKGGGILAYGATDNIGADISGDTDVHSIFISSNVVASGGTNNIGLLLGDYVKAIGCTVFALDGSGENHSIAMAGTQTNRNMPFVQNCFTGGYTANAYGLVVQAGCTGRASGNFFDSATAGVLIEAGSTLYASSNHIMSLAGPGTIVYEASDVAGPASAVDGNIATFDGTSGHLIQDSGYPASSLDDLHNHVVNEDHSAECDGAETGFATHYIFRSRSTAVYINGLRQREHIHYTEDIDLQGVTFVAAPETGDELVIDYINDDGVMEEEIMALIQQITPTGTTVTFSAIPQTFTHLRLDYMARSDLAAVITEDDIEVALNGDGASANYRLTLVYANGDNVLDAIGGDGNGILAVPAVNAPADEFVVGSLEIPYYASAVQNKHVKFWYAYRPDKTTDEESHNSGAMNWENNDPVTSIEIAITGNFVVGSTFRLYGIY